MYTIYVYTLYEHIYCVYMYHVFVHVCIYIYRYLHGCMAVDLNSSIFKQPFFANKVITFANPSRPTFFFRGGLTLKSVA